MDVTLGPFLDTPCFPLFSLKDRGMSEPFCRAHQSSEKGGGGLVSYLIPISRFLPLFLLDSSWSHYLSVLTCGQLVCLSYCSTDLPIGTEESHAEWATHWICSNSELCYHTALFTLHRSQLSCSVTHLSTTHDPPGSQNGMGGTSKGFCFCFGSVWLLFWVCNKEDWVRHPWGEANDINISSWKARKVREDAVT